MPKLTRQEEEEGPGDFSLDEKSRQAYLTEEGHEKIESMFASSGLVQVLFATPDAF